VADAGLSQPDALKGTLERIEAAVLAAFSEADRRAYDEQFTFFARVTAISGALRPLIRRPKAERKVRSPVVATETRTHTAIQSGMRMTD
jgi:hypothetical protein